MTTSVRVHVNGRYRATVVQTNSDGTEQPPVIIEGNYEGSPNPSGEATFWLPHPASASFKVTEEYVPEQKADSAAP